MEESIKPKYDLLSAQRVGDGVAIRPVVAGSSSAWKKRERRFEGMRNNPQGRSRVGAVRKVAVGGIVMPTCAEEPARKKLCIAPSSPDLPPSGRSARGGGLKSRSIFCERRSRVKCTCIGLNKDVSLPANPSNAAEMRAGGGIRAAAVDVERTVFYREKAAGMYSSLPYGFAQDFNLLYLCQVAIEIPCAFFEANLYGVLVYSIINFDWTVVKFFWYLFFTFHKRVRRSR
ncbi:Pleiotropic drug resistance protein 1 [Platanthera guangdongensis]|uniref:Pleiotropic drug resistance protein 1 n=1 Tax=Platanthera guangdongensis TaxID=2320717 RepID=A0ABR2LXE1_9ASPA